MKELEDENWHLKKMYLEEKLKAEIVAEALEKVVRPSRGKEMTQKAATERGVCIRVAYQAFVISEACYRYAHKLDAVNVEVVNWLIKLTDKNRSWGFGLCFQYLRNFIGNKNKSQEGVLHLKGPGSKFADQAPQAVAACEA